MKLLKSFTKQEKSWMMYDWANSAHSVIVVTLLPIFYNTVAGFTSDAATSMSTWGFATSLAMLVIAVLAPVLGAFGDFNGWKKKLFFCFMLLGVLSVAVLAFTPMMPFAGAPEIAEKVGLVILILYILSTIGFAGANLYYDSFLTDVTTDDRMDKVSTMGYGLGYIGGSTVPLLIFLILNLIGVPMLYCLCTAFGLTSVWWLLFSIPLLKNVNQSKGIEPRKGAVKEALLGLGATVKEIFKNKSIFIFLLAYFFYIDGVNTIIHMSTSYGDTLGIDSTQMMLALLLVQLLGLPFALLYIKLSEKFGTRAMIGVAIIVYMGISVFGFFVREVWHFWVLAILVSTSQGGVQALSRSMFGKMIPDKNRSAEFFGFYDIFGKFSAIMGPSIVGAVSLLASNVIRGMNNFPQNPTAQDLERLAQQSAPWGVLSVLLIFFVGAALYFFVLPRYLKKEKKETGNKR